MINFIKKFTSVILSMTMLLSVFTGVSIKSIYADTVYATDTLYNVSEFMGTGNYTEEATVMRLKSIDTYKNLGKSNMFGAAVKNSDGDYEVTLPSYSYKGIKDGGEPKVLQINVPKDGTYTVNLLARDYKDRGFSVQLGDKIVTGTGSSITALGTSALCENIGIHTAVFDDVKAGVYDLTLSYSGTASKEVAYFYSMYIKYSKPDVLYYKDTDLSFEERAADLVSRMTLEEKVSQLGHGAAAIPRLGIQKYNYWREGIHGVARQGKATSFPSSLSMSNTWDKDLVYRAADITSTEARGKNSKYNLSYWSPTINMARDPRWGRNEESYGEDPYLTTQYGIEFVKGMQGNDEKYLKTIATLKHFAANNCEAERQGGSSVMDERTLYDYYTKAFKGVVEAAKPASIMSSYNAITLTRNGETVYDYIASPANKHLLTDLLRRNWGFTGYVTGDCGAVNNLNGRLTYKRTFFKDVKDLTEIPQSATIALAIKAGNELDCGAVSQENGYEAVTKGYMTEEELDLAVYRLFLQRMRTGEFDQNAAYQNITSSVLETDEHIAVAEEAAEKSWVLLKNQDNTLPLNTNVKNIAIVGSLANEVVLGDYSGEPEYTVTPYEGIKAEVLKQNPNAQVNLLGSTTDDTKLFNLKSLTLVLKDGKTRSIDLSKAENVTGMTKTETGFKDITTVASAVIKSVDFSNVASVKAETSTGGQIGGYIKFAYGSGGPQVAEIASQSTDSLDSYKESTAPYTGTDGGYNGTADLYLSFSAKDVPFTVENYKEQLDNADIIIAYAGTTTSDSSESHDRDSIKLPASQAHVDTITSAYPEKTVVVMQTVGQIDVSSFKDKCKAILWTSYNGQTQGTALGKIIMGEVNPSGKLSTTWYAPKDLEIMRVNTDGIYDDEQIKWHRNDYSIRQKENFPGRTYQYYNGNPEYPFGFGLSYTNFEYSDLTLSKTDVNANGDLTATVKVKNSGSKDGAEVVQLYVRTADGDGVNQPLKQLKGFERVELKAGEEKTVSFKVEIEDLALYNEDLQKLYIPTGAYTLMVGKNAADSAMLTKEFTVSGTLNSSLKTVAVVPSGISIVGITKNDGNPSQTLVSVSANMSAVMSDDVNCDLSKATVEYTSSNPNIAVVSNNGLVTAGTEEGMALITASVTADGVTKEAAFPVKCTLKVAISDAERNGYLDMLDKAYQKYDSTLYSEKNWNEITSIYNTARQTILNEIDSENLEPVTIEAIEEMAEIKLKPVDGLDIYEISSVNDELYGKLSAVIKYNGDEKNPSAVIVTSVFDQSGAFLRKSETVVSESGEYEINDKFNDGEKLSIFIWDNLDNMQYLSQKTEHTYTKQIGPSLVVYNFTDGEFDRYFGTTDGVALKEVNGLMGYGGFATAQAKTPFTYTVNGVDYKFSRGLKSGGGGDKKRCLYFEPFMDYTKCKVTVLFDAQTERCQYIMQNGKVLATSYGNGEGTLATVSCEITDLTKPVYTYGGSSNKSVFGIVIEYE